MKKVISRLDRFSSYNWCDLGDHHNEHACTWFYLSRKEVEYVRQVRDWLAKAQKHLRETVTLWENVTALVSDDSIFVACRTPREWRRRLVASRTGVLMCVE